ncbi:MAG TPA: glycoside hydrolase family 31 protein [Ktedonobacteraceae bacterium]|nr:glycoside hydrolase family 31 protein [Ktedonobacteraceae bacterium]
MSISIKNLGALGSFSHEGRTLMLDFGGPRVAITVLTDSLVRVRLAPEGAFEVRHSWAVASADEVFSEETFEIEDSDLELTLRTAALSVKINRESGALTFENRQGQPFCVDEAAMQWRQTEAGSRTVSCAKRIESGEHFFGFGERTGPLDKLGRQLINWTTDPAHGHGPGTDPLYQAIPVFMALRPGVAYGVFFNNTWRSQFDIGAEQPDVWRMEAEGGELDYYVVYGPSPVQVSEGLGMLLGTMPLPPRWALGYHHSRWGHATESMIRDLTSEFRRRNIPCDVIHLDIDYMNGYRVFTWNQQSFPDPQSFINHLRRDGFRIVTIIDPGVKSDPGYSVYQSGIELDVFIRRSDGTVFHGYVWPDDAVFADFTRPEVREWWGIMQKALVEVGVSGIWNDMNEPTSFELPFSEGAGEIGTIDLDAVQGPEGERTTHAEVHNLYGYGMARAAYEGLRKYNSNERPFVLTRSGFAGIQRWSACWMGDNHSWWEHLEMAMPQLMNMGLSGVPFVGTDIGGFSGNASGELFARWMQFGILSPFCRAHTEINTERHEPWVFGQQVEDICRDFLRLRYRLLPYIYSLFWEASRRGIPILRPLLYHFPDDPITYSLHDQVMLGPQIMAAPIYHPGREHRHVYLPEGEWYDWWTDEKLIGPTHLLAYAPLERMPLYVRAGAIIPSGPDLHHADEYPLHPLTLDVYPGEGEFTLYEDDGHSFEYEQGQFCTTTYRLRLTKDRLAFEIDARQGDYIPPKRQLVIKVHAVDERAVLESAGAVYDSARRLLMLQFDEDGGAQTFSFKK